MFDFEISGIHLDREKVKLPFLCCGSCFTMISSVPVLLPASVQRELHLKNRSGPFHYEILLRVGLNAVLAGSRPAGRGNSELTMASDSTGASGVLGSG